MKKRARLLVILATVLALLGAGSFVGYRMLQSHVDDAIPQEDLFGSPSLFPSLFPSPTPSPSGPPPGADIKGPLNILIVGIDTREWDLRLGTRSDAVIILHVSADLQHTYMTSLPRDLLVDIPAFPATGYRGGHTKLTHAMMYGSRIPGNNRAHNLPQGFKLLAATVSRYTGIARFDAGAILTFTGLTRLVDAVDGVDMHIDQKVVSIHMQPNGVHRKPCGSCEYNYSGPRMTYNVGKKHMTGWMALDYARQRYTTGATYTRERHQHQIIKAIFTKALQLDLISNPAKFESILQALGQTFTFDGRGRKPSEYLYALRNVRPADMTLVGLPGHGVFSGGSYKGEGLDGVQSSYFAALRKDTLAAWTLAHPSLIQDFR